ARALGGDDRRRSGSETHRRTGPFETGSDVSVSGESDTSGTQAFSNHSLVRCSRETCEPHRYYVKPRRCLSDVYVEDPDIVRPAAGGRLVSLSAKGAGMLLRLPSGSRRLRERAGAEQHTKH